MIVVSGLSGSGKSIALHTLEDLNYYCVDNLPLGLLKPFTEVLLNRRLTGAAGAADTIAVGIDSRNFLDQLPEFPAVLRQLRDLPVDVDVLFLQASDNALLKRYSETRRRHPLSSDGSPLIDAIRRERQLLGTISGEATLTIDTSQSNVHELRDLIRQRLYDAAPQHLNLLIESCGFKNGVPVDADFVFDVRCLPNPHWEPCLRPLTGLDQPVVDYLAGNGDVERMFDDIGGFLERWIPRFDTGSRSYLTIAVGCTGGQHRSVYLVERLARHLTGSPLTVMTRHRELQR